MSLKDQVHGPFIVSACCGAEDWNLLAAVVCQFYRNASNSDYPSWRCSGPLHTCPFLLQRERRDYRPIKVQSPIIERIDLSKITAIQGVLKYTGIGTANHKKSRSLSENRHRSFGWAVVFLLTYPLANHAPIGGGEDYRDLEANHFETRQQYIIVKQPVRKLENLGFTVTLSNTTAS